MAFDKQRREELIHERIEFLREENKKRYGDATGVMDDDDVADEKFKELIERI